MYANKTDSFLSTFNSLSHDHQDLILLILLLLEEKLQGRERHRDLMS